MAWLGFGDSETDFETNIETDCKMNMMMATDRSLVHVVSMKELRRILQFGLLLARISVSVFRLMYSYAQYSTIAYGLNK